MKVKSKSKKLGANASKINLPRDYPWKVLQAMLADLREYLNAEDISELEDIIRKRDVAGLLALRGRWGLQSIAHSGGIEFQKSKARYQLSALLSKFNFAGSREAREKAATEKFIAAEAQCRSFNLEGWKELAASKEEWKVIALTQAKAFLQKLLGVVLPESSQLCEWSRHGPGATLDTEKGKVSTYDKWKNWPYQCTGAVLALAKIAIRSDARWLGALEDDYRTRNNIPKHFLLDRKVFWQSVLQIVDGDRIAFVPKNAETFRTITIGPTLNIYLQLGVDGFIRRRLKRWGVDLDSQEKNQRLAYIGSLGGIDPYCTLDLAAASDTVSLKLCELLLPDEWYFYLWQLRSPMARLGKTEIWLHKMSAMGNGFTFVLESAIFTALIYGVMMATSGKFDREDFSVFGDDLVVRQSLVPRLTEMLSSCGFKINAEKSFTSGFVRESCGTDWVKGKPVRPVFLEDTPTDVKELFSAINRLKRYLNLRWGLEESETVRLMSKWIPESFGTCKGPYSDTEFDSHLHSEKPISEFTGGRWEYTRVVYHPEQRSARSFLFRKLMHDLRPAQPTPSYVKGRRKLTSQGSRFAVSHRNGETVGKLRSAAYEWRSEYAESLPT